MPLYAVTVLYVKTDETDCSAVALIGAPNAGEAIALAAEAVLALPHCLALIGGECEEIDPNARAVPNAPSEAQATPRYRPDGATLH
jgi:hypothetical protein